MRVTISIQLTVEVPDNTNTESLTVEWPQNDVYKGTCQGPLRVLESAELPGAIIPAKYIAHETVSVEIV